MFLCAATNYVSCQDAKANTANYTAPRHTVGPFMLKACLQSCDSDAVQGQDEEQEVNTSWGRDRGKPILF